jgi:hypothetical protein
MDFLTFEETRERTDEFYKLIEKIDELQYIIRHIFVKQFREYYTPNIPYSEESVDLKDINIFIKNKIFSAEIDNEIVPHIIKIYIKQQTTEGLEYLETISLREFLYVYSNPEGFEILDKIQFIINNENWEEIKDKLHGNKFEDYDDIPF